MTRKERSVMEGSHDEIKKPEVRKPGMKKPYSKPELIVHGTVERITEEQKGSGTLDGGAMSTNRRSR